MSTPRTAIIRHRDAPKGHCRWCGEPIDKALHPHARSWHQGCVDAWQRQDPKWQRATLWQRDHGRCAECGTHARDLIERIRGQAYWHGIRMSGHRGVPGPLPSYDSRGPVGISVRHAVNAGALRLPYPWRDYVRKRANQGWHADHIVPLWAGGANDVSNMQTLCETCHKAKTRREAGERAQRRREERTGQQSLLGGAA